MEKGLFIVMVLMAVWFLLNPKKPKQKKTSRDKRKPTQNKKLSESEKLALIKKIQEM